MSFFLKEIDGKFNWRHGPAFISCFILSKVRIYSYIPTIIVLRLICTPLGVCFLLNCRTNYKKEIINYILKYREKIYPKSTVEDN